MELPQLWWLIVPFSLISLSAFWRYSFAMKRGLAVPTQATWFIWLLSGILIFIGLLRVPGGWFALALAGAYILGYAYILRHVLKYGEKKWDWIDIVLCIVAFLSIIPWTLTGSPFWMIHINILIDLVGLVPTLKSAWRDPRREDWVMWSIAALGAGGVLFVAVLDGWKLSEEGIMEWSFALYMALGNASVAILSFPWKKFLNSFAETASTFDVTGYTMPLSYRERFGTDRDALASDWYAVGNYLRDVLGLPRVSFPKSKKRGR